MIKKLHVTTGSGSSDQLETVTTISTDSSGVQKSGDSLATTTSGNHAGMITTPGTRPGLNLREVEVEYESLQRRRMYTSFDWHEVSCLR